MDLSRLERLKTLLATSKDISKIFEYFMDHFGLDSDFLELGKRTERPELTQMVLIAGEQIFKKRCVMQMHFLIEVPGTTFIHGAGMLNGHLLNVLYFEDIWTGAVALAANKEAELTHFSRFTCQRLPPEAIPGRN